MATTSHAVSDSFDRLVEIMAQLRDPKTGCPWDIAQNFETIAPYTLEEAYEVIDAIKRKDTRALQDELGDLLLQVVFHSQMASEEKSFDIQDVIDGICEKMIRRHPHVFADEKYDTADEQLEAWEKIKENERTIEKLKKLRKFERESSALDGVAIALPALLRAEKLSKRAARVGFDWPNTDLIFDKIEEEIIEIHTAMQSNNRDEIENEIGDLLFAVANLARKLSVEPETAMRKANDKFERRFRSMENIATKKEREFSKLDLNAQENLWEQVKSDEQ